MINELSSVKKKRYKSVLKQIKEASCTLSSLITTDDDHCLQKEGTHSESNEAACSSSSLLSEQNKLSVSYIPLIESGYKIH